MDTEDFTAKRRRLGLSLRDVERESGIAFSTLAQFERGERIGSRVAAGIATWVADPDPKRRIEVALTREGKYLVGYSNEGEAGGFILLGDITDQLASFSSPAAGREEVARLVDPQAWQWYDADVRTGIAQPHDTWRSLEAADAILALLAKRPTAEGEMRLTDTQIARIIKSLRTSRSLPSGNVRNVDEYEAQGWLMDDGRSMGGERIERLRESRETDRATIAEIDAVLDALGAGK